MLAMAKYGLPLSPVWAAWHVKQVSVNTEKKATAEPGQDMRISAWLRVFLYLNDWILIYAPFDFKSILRFLMQLI